MLFVFILNPYTSTFLAFGSFLALTFLLGYILLQVCHVDPRMDTSWRKLKNKVKVHQEIKLIGNNFTRL